MPRWNGTEMNRIAPRLDSGKLFDPGNWGGVGWMAMGGRSSAGGNETGTQDYIYASRWGHASSS